MNKSEFIPISEPSLGQTELEYVTDCVKSGWVSSLGKYIGQFENGFAEFCGTKYGVSVFNGTVAIHLALVALGIGAGDEVIVPTFTFVATANAVLYTGATPVFVDSELETWNMDPQDIKAKITSKTKAIIVVHIYGHPAKMDEILAIAKENNLKVIEDAAESHGAEYQGQKVGSMGDVGCFSFYGNKIITTGEGGIVVTNNQKLADEMRFLKDHAMSTERKYYHPLLGFNYRMTNLQAALGVAQLEKLKEFIIKKQEIAAWYRQEFAGVNGLGHPPEVPWASNVYWMYSLLIKPEAKLSRDDLAKKLKAKGVDSRPFFLPNHQMPYMPPEVQKQNFPVARVLSEQGLNLPSAVSLTREKIKYVAECIEEIVTNAQA